MISNENAIDPTLMVRRMLSDYGKYLGLCKGNCTVSTFGKKIVMSCWFSTLSRIEIKGADPNETPKIENPVSGNPIETPFVEVPLG